MNMKNLIKQKHVGIMLTIIGMSLLSLNFLSYLMNSAFVSKAVLPIGIILAIAGVILIRRTKNLHQ